jgi:imidazoleglycerol phosphate synthase cyclase subunit
MLTKRIIPCLDIRDGRVVKGVRFSGLRDAGDPVEQSVRYQDQGADEIVMLDVSATPDARSTAIETVSAVREALSIPLTVGGGVRCVADAERLLCAGADKVAVNTAAVERPDILAELADRTGSQCVVLALDAARRAEQPGWEVVTRSGTNRTGLDALQWAENAEIMGVGELLLTSWDRDGTGDGYDLDLLRAMSSRVRVPIIASGGAAGADDLLAALNNGADAVLAASIFHDAIATVQDVKASLAERDMEVRL